LKVFPLEIELRDRFFGESLKGKISLERIDPNTGSSKRYAIVDGSIVIPQLPSGTYIIKVEDKIGLAETGAVVLSKPQNIVINIISYKSILLFSIAIIGFLVAAIVLGKRLSKIISTHEGLRV
jgi:hypothetical protein